MCWNAEVSLNTFVFSCFVLLLIFYNNTYTQYKIKELHHFWIYMFFLSFFFMQFFEYFIWKNINNSYYNSLYTKMAGALLLIQPIVTLMLLNNRDLKNTLIFIYCFIAIPFAIYRFAKKRMYSTVSPLGHLSWHMFTTKNEYYIFYCWLFFFLFSFFYNKSYYAFLFGIITLMIITYNYNKDQSVGSMWCWVVNSVMIYYAFYLLIYLPFLEKNKLC